MQQIRQIGNVSPGTNRDNPNQGRVYDISGLCPTLSGMTGGGRQPHIVEVEPLQNYKFIGSLTGMHDGYAGAVFDTNSNCPALTTMSGGGRQPHIIEVNDLVGVDLSINDPHTNEVANCIAARVDRGISTHRAEGSGVLDVSRVESDEKLGKFVYEEDGEKYLVRVRKLTPRSCWRLMGFSDEDFDKASSVVSNTQLYKQAGNSICKPVLESLFRQMLPLNTVTDYKAKALSILNTL